MSDDRPRLEFAGHDRGVRTLRLAALLIALALAACAPSAPPQAQCDMTRIGQESFTSVTDRDSLTASSQGSCAAATITFTVSTPEGANAYSWGGPAPAPTDRQSMNSLLTSMAKEEVTYTTLAPFWRQLRASCWSAVPTPPISAWQILICCHRSPA